MGLRLSKHLGFFKHLDDFRFKWWLDSNAHNFLETIGIEQGQKVLDFGCGKGTYSIPASMIVGPTGIVYVLDVNAEALDKVVEKSKVTGLKNIRIIKSSGDAHIDLTDNCIDHMLLIDVLQEIVDKLTLFKEANRILKENGVVTVYPMHIKNEDVMAPANKSGFKLTEVKYNDRILILKKT